MDLDACYRSLGFREPPFRITPDTDYFFPHAQYLTAIGHLRYGMLTGSFAVITGEVGLGKTLLCRYLLRNLPGDVQTAYVFNPQQSFLELIKSIYHDLTGLTTESDSQAEVQDLLYEALIQISLTGKRVALLVDEAHRLNPEVLEGIRLLSNLETEKRKLMALLLIGQTELETSLKSHQMRALRERISVWHRLRSYTRAETMAYVRHRLNSARLRGNFRLTLPALMGVHWYSKGVPRRINLICDRAMLMGFVDQRPEVTLSMVRAAAGEVQGWADQ
jgi:general secretion pathway protein A